MGDSLPSVSLGGVNFEAVGVSSGKEFNCAISVTGAVKVRQFVFLVSGMNSKRGVSPPPYAVLHRVLLRIVCVGYIVELAVRRS